MNITHETPDLDTVIADLEAKHSKVSDEPFELGLVFYCDGGAEDSRTANEKLGRCYSFAVHGYLYCNTPLKRGIGLGKVMPTNIGYIHEEKLASWFEGNYFLTDEAADPTPLKNKIVTPVAYFEYVGNDRGESNNVGELRAVHKAIEIYNHFKEKYTIVNAHVRSDSEYTTKGSARLKKTSDGGWKRADGKPILNLDWWKQTEAIYAELRNETTVWSIEHVAGHTDWFGNIQADKNSTLALRSMMNKTPVDDLVITDAQGYWGNRAAAMKHYFFADSRLYIHADTGFSKTEDGLNILHVGSHEVKKDSGHTRCGVETGDYGQAVIYLEHIPNIAVDLYRRIKSHEARTDVFDPPGVWTAHLDLAIKLDASIRFGDPTSFTTERNLPPRLIDVDKKEVLAKITPSRTALMHYDNFSYLNGLLDMVKNHPDELPNGMILTDITHEIYKQNVNEKTGKVKVECIISKERSFKSNVKYHYQDSDNVYSEKLVDLTFTYGVTAPKQRVFSGVKDDKPRVLVLTHFKPVVFVAYYLIIILENGEAGIWANMAANERNTLNIKSE